MDKLYYNLFNLDIPRVFKPKYISKINNPSSRKNAKVQSHKISQKIKTKEIKKSLKIEPKPKLLLMIPQAQQVQQMQQC